MSDPTIADLKQDLLNRVNSELDIPFIGEDTEGLILGVVLRPLLDRIPVRLLPLMYDASDGLTQEELDRHIDGLSDFVNKLIDVPYVIEAIEGRLIRVAIRAALSPLLKGDSL